MTHARLDDLQRKHANLEQQLDDEAHRPLPNQQAIAEIKREKLRLKDEIVDMQRR